MPIKAVFFDRDNTLTHDAGYTFKVSNLCWIDGAKQTIRRFNESGFKVFVVTNQSGVARGYYSEEDVVRFHRAMQNDLRNIGAKVDRFIYCPHLKSSKILEYAKDCDCRKPNPGMITKMITTFDLCKSQSFLVGDSPSDVEAAHAAGISGYLFDQMNLWCYMKSKGLLKC